MSNQFLQGTVAPIHGFKDRARLALSWAVGLAIPATLAATGAVSIPVLLGAAGFSFFLRNRAIKIFEKLLAAERQKLDRKTLHEADGFRHLSAVAKIMAKRLGLKKTPDLHTFIREEAVDENGKKKTSPFKTKKASLFKTKKASLLKTKKASLLKTKKASLFKTKKASLFKTMKKLPNAFLFQNSSLTNDCTLTRPILKSLNDLEECAVVGHELGHAAAKHLETERSLSLLYNSAQLGTSWNLFSAMATSPAGIALMGTQILLVLGFNKLFNSGFNDLDSEDPEKRALAKRIKTTRTFCNAALMLTAPTLLGAPHISALWLVSKGTNLACRAWNGLCSRGKEYQADRLGALASNSPLALASGLRKIESTIEAQMKKDDADQGFSVGALFRRAEKALFSSHPSVKRRCKRLERLARRMEKNRPSPASNA